MNDPRRLNELAEAQEEIDVRTQMQNTPLTTEHLAGDISGERNVVKAEHYGTHVTKALDAAGVEIKFIPGGKGAGYYSKTTGKRLTLWDLHTRRNLVTGVIAGATHPRIALEQVQESGAGPARKEATAQLAKYEEDPTPFHDQKVLFLQAQQAKLKDPSMLDGAIAQAVRERAEAIRKAIPTKKGAGLPWEDWKRREDYKAGLKKDKPEKPPKPPDLDELNKALSYELYDDKGEPREVDTSTKNRMMDLAEQYGRTLNFEETEDGWIIIGLAKSKSVAGAVLDSSRTAGKGKGRGAGRRMRYDPKADTFTTP
jgi:hypothetical protein